jgi:hypothetical protein
MVRVKKLIDFLWSLIKSKYTGGIEVHFSQGNILKVFKKNEEIDLAG